MTGNSIKFSLSTWTWGGFKSSWLELYTLVGSTPYVLELLISYIHRRIQGTLLPQ